MSHLTYQYKLLPTKAQRRVMESILERQRVLFNYGLRQRKWEWEQNKVSLSKRGQFKDLTRLRGEDDDYGSLPANLSRWTLDKLDKAMAAFYRRVREKADKAGYPRFKGKGRMRSFGFVEWSGITLAEGRLRFKGLPSSLRVLMHRPLPRDAVITSCTIGLKCGVWTVSLQLELPDVEPQKAFDDPSLTYTAYDLGRERAVTFHDGTGLETVRLEERYRARVKKAQRAVSRSRLGSNSRRKKILALGRVKHHEANARRTMGHQHSAAIVEKADIIGVDALAVKQMTRRKEGTKKQRGMNRSNLDAGYTMLNAMVRYKAARAGKRTVDYEPAYTSQDCAMCWSRGVLTRRRKALGERQHRCDVCGFAEHRDVNGALNGYGRAHGVDRLRAFMQEKYGPLELVHEGVMALGFDAPVRDVHTYVPGGG